MGHACLAPFPKKIRLKNFQSHPLRLTAGRLSPLTHQEKPMTPADQLDRLVFYTLLLSGAVALYPW